MRAPTSARWMNDKEWEIVTGVYNSSTLPFKQRIIITDALGGGNRPFTIPTSLISSLPVVIAGAFAGGLAGAAGTTVASYLTSIVNLGYFMNVGASAYPDMSSSYKALLVHETAHVWQGKNSTFALSYVFGSAISQCAGVLGGSGTGGAYSYTAGNAWGSYNPEQQASIIEDWFKAGESGSHSLYPYIRDYVRKGKTS